MANFASYVWSLPSFKFTLSGRAYQAAKTKCILFLACRIIQCNPIHTLAYSVAIPIVGISEFQADALRAKRPKKKARSPMVSLALRRRPRREARQRRVEREGMG